jgi:hypothetical protein
MIHRRIPFISGSSASELDSETLSESDITGNVPASPPWPARQRMRSQ